MKTRVRRKPNNNNSRFRLLSSVLGFENVVDGYGCVSPFTVFCSCVLIFLNLANFALCNASENISKYANESLLETGDLFETAREQEESTNPANSIWSEFLEEYVLSQGTSSRSGKDLPYMTNINEITAPGLSHPMTMMGSNMAGPQSMQSPLNYHSSMYKRPLSGGMFITKRIGEAAELEPHMRPPVVNPQFRPMTNQMIHQQQQHQQQQHQQQQHQQQHQPGFLEQLFGIGGGSSSSPTAPPPPSLHQPQMRPVPLQQHHPQSIRAVSENDLYLLGAIEKLVYRVDYLESRIRRAEQLLYYLAGNNKKEVRDNCPTNFTRISEHCYYINSHQQVNWKTANTACKGLNAHLAEFERVSENEDIMAYLLNQQNHRGRDYWLGGLNPGLLWIWSNSAKPVNPNMNLTSIAMSQKNETASIESNLVDDGKTDVTDNDGILNNTIEIKGQGRCLRLSYNPTKHAYSYYGQECTSRHHYICEYEDKSLENKIKKITRELKLFN